MYVQGAHVLWWKGHDFSLDYRISWLELWVCPMSPLLVSWDLKNVAVLFPMNFEFCSSIFSYSWTEQLDKWVSLIELVWDGSNTGTAASEQLLLEIIGLVFLTQWLLCSPSLFRDIWVAEPHGLHGSPRIWEVGLIWSNWSMNGSCNERGNSGSKSYRLPLTLICSPTRWPQFEKEQTRQCPSLEQICSFSNRGHLVLFLICPGLPDVC